MSDQSNRRHQVQPVQIVAPSQNDGKLRLDEETLHSVLGDSSIQNNEIVIVSVAGIFRKGKSFLLNFFLEFLYSLQRAQQSGSGGSTETANGLNDEEGWLSEDARMHGFHWRGGAARDTQGIWIWGEPIIIQTPAGDSLAVLLMDTQGSFDNQSTFQQCSTIFALSTIVSSLQVYNVVGNINEASLQNLSFFVKYGRLAMDDASHSGKPFQSLCFCVRDWQSAEDFSFGADGGQKYLGHVLEVFPNQAPELSSLRQQLRECFEQLQCILLPHPGAEVAEKKLFNGTVKDIRPEFCNEIRRMVPFLLSPKELQPKKINGKPVTCKNFIEYFKVYCETFESPEMPTPQNILEANTRLICYAAADEARSEYCRLMDEATNCDTKIPERHLMELHKSYGMDAKKIFDQHSKIFANDDRDEHHERLQKIINEEFKRYKKSNAWKKLNWELECALFILDCAESPFVGVGLAGATSGAAWGCSLIVDSVLPATTLAEATMATIPSFLAAASLMMIPTVLAGLTITWICVAFIDDECFEVSCESFESPEMTTPQTILEANGRLIVATDEARSEYCRLMDEATSCNTMIPETQLLELHLRCGMDAKIKFDQHSTIANDDREDNHDGLEKIINEEFERYKKANSLKKLNWLHGCEQFTRDCGEFVLARRGLAVATFGTVAAAVLFVWVGLVSA